MNNLFMMMKIVMITQRTKRLNRIKMKKIIQYFAILAFLFSLNGVFAQVPSPSKKQGNGILLTGGTAHLGTGEVIENSAIAFNDGKIVFVGKQSEPGAAYS